MAGEVRPREKEDTKVKVEEKDHETSSTDEVPGEEEPFEEQEIIGLKELENEVLQYIVGQDEQVRRIVTAVYRALVFPSIKSNILIIGNSGTGKTATVKQIAQILDIPCTIEDATKYTQEGYYGSDVNEMIYNLIEAADDDIAKAWNGIIVIDEIDKKASSGESHDVAGVEVLKSLLKIIEGTTIMVPPPDFVGELISFDTSNLIIIFMGAFPGLNKIRDTRLNKNSVGFVQSKAEAGGNTKILKQDLVKYGLPEEFVGRVDTIVEMNNLGYQELVEILRKSKLSIFRRYVEEFKRIGITLEYEEGLFDDIAKASLTLDTGARELTNTVNYIFECIVYEVLTNPEKYSKCKLLPGIVDDNTRYELS